MAWPSTGAGFPSTGPKAFHKSLPLHPRPASARRESEERYRTLFEYAPDGIVITEPAGHAIDVHARVCRLLDYPREQLIGRHAAEILAEEERARLGPVLRRINPAVRIIAASGLPTNVASLGVKHFLPKPFSAETLLKTLKQVLSEKV